MKKMLVIIALVLGIVFFVCSIVYFIEPARSLPGFFPGHDVTSAKPHYKHGIGALLLAVGAFVYVWFQTGKKS